MFSLCREPDPLRTDLALLCLRIFSSPDQPYPTIYHTTPLAFPPPKYPPDSSAECALLIALWGHLCGYNYVIFLLVSFTVLMCCSRSRSDQYWECCHPALQYLSSVTTVGTITTLVLSTILIQMTLSDWNIERVLPSFPLQSYKITLLEKIDVLWLDWHLILSCDKYGPCQQFNPISQHSEWIIFPSHRLTIQTPQDLASRFASKHNSGFTIYSLL